MRETGVTEAGRSLPEPELGSAVKAEEQGGTIVHENCLCRCSVPQLSS